MHCNERERKERGARTCTVKASKCPSVLHKRIKVGPHDDSLHVQMWVFRAWGLCSACFHDFTVHMILQCMSKGSIHVQGFHPRVPRWNRSGTHLVSGSDDGTIRVWDATSGECLEVIDGEGDVEAIALAGQDGQDFRAICRGIETVVETPMKGVDVAWFAAPLENISTHPLGGVWAGSANKHIYLIRLEGAVCHGRPKLRCLDPTSDTDPSG